MANEEKKLIAFFLAHNKVSYKKGRTIINAQDPPTGVYYVYKGFVKDCTISEDGKSFTLVLYKEGDIFPYNWIFNKIPNKHTFEAYTDCTLLRAPREHFLDFLINNPEVLFMLTHKILMRFLGVLQRLEDFAFGTAHQRVASIFAILSERFGVKQSGIIQITIPLSHKEIAELVGLTRETASIEINKLEKLGAISRKSRWYIVKNYKLLLRNSPHE